MESGPSTTCSSLDQDWSFDVHKFPLSPSFPNHASIPCQCSSIDTALRQIGVYRTACAANWFLGFASLRTRPAGDASGYRNQFECCVCCRVCGNHFRSQTRDNCYGSRALKRASGLPGHCALLRCRCAILPRRGGRWKSATRKRWHGGAAPKSRHPCSTPQLESHIRRNEHSFYERLRGESFHRTRSALSLHHAPCR